MADRMIGAIKLAAKKIQGLPRDTYTLSKVIDEYDISFRELFTDLDRAISRVLALCNTRNQFKDISSYSQRKKILTHLNSISKDIAKGDNFIQDLDNLKLEIKEFAYMKYIKSSAKDIEAEVEKLRKTNSKLLREKTNLLRVISTLSDKVQKIKDSIEQSETNRIKLEELGDTLIKHDNQLEVQNRKYIGYDKSIEAYKKEKQDFLKLAKTENKDLLKEIQKTQEEAKKSMRLGAAAGISAGFQAQYNEIKGIRDKGKDGIVRMLVFPFIGGRAWILGAFTFSLVAIGIGIWLGYEEGIKINAIYARLSLIFISLTGAWFCARQYINIFNIATDYAYKSTLAKSIDAFSETLKDNDASNENYREYIKKILDEIHQHPLRNYKKQAAVTPTEKIVEVVLEKLSNKKVLND
jgi:hypothetical protein